MKNSRQILSMRSKLKVQKEYNQSHQQIKQRSKSTYVAEWHWPLHDQIWTIISHCFDFKNRLQIHYSYFHKAQSCGSKFTFTSPPVARDNTNTKPTEKRKTLLSHTRRHQQLNKGARRLHQLTETSINNPTIISKSPHTKDNFNKLPLALLTIF